MKKIQQVQVTTVWERGNVNTLKTDLCFSGKGEILAFLRPFCENGVYANTVVAEGDTFKAILTFETGVEIYVYEAKQ